jgi:nickel transport protein
VKAADLPPDLPPPEDGARGESPAALAPDTGTRPAADGATPEAAPTDRTELERVVDAVVTRRIRPLGEKLEAYEGRRRLADVLGGIGYILGLAGLVFYFKASARKRAAGQAPDG